MNLASTALVAYMFLDFMAPLPLLNPVETGSSALSVTGAGDLAVSVNQPQSIGSVARGATRIPFLNINLSASCESDIRLSSIDLKHIGLGSISDIAGVYALDGFARVTRSARFDTQSSTATLRFRKLTIKKCSAVNLTVMADISTTATVASEHGMSVSDAATIISSAKKVALTQGDSSLRVVPAPSNVGTLTARFLPVYGPIRYGREETVARLQLTADTRNAHLLKKITLTNTEDARDMDLQWLKLETLSGQQLTPAAARMHDYTAVLEFSPTYILSAGKTIVLNLKAQVRGGQSKKVNFELEEPSDLVAVPYNER